VLQRVFHSPIVLLVLRRISSLKGCNTRLSPPLAISGLIGLCTIQPQPRLGFFLQYETLSLQPVDVLKSSDYGAVCDMSEPTSLQQANALLEHLPGRRTRGRAAVLSTLITADRALSHHEIETVLGTDAGLDRVTLYRVLDWLAEHQVVHKVVGADRAARYAFARAVRPSAVSDADHAHAHFQCDTCGRVECLPSVATPSPVVPGGYMARSVDVLVHGVCPLCARPAGRGIRAGLRGIDPR
jgi:Fur family transcriptional regulator, ferric uptake regulator